MKLDGIGTFWPTLKNKKGGLAAEDIVADGFNPETQIIGVNINFMGDQKKLDNLTRHAFQEYCTLEAGYAIKCYNTTVNGKKVVRHYKMPMNEWKNGATFPSELPSDNVEP